MKSELIAARLVEMRLHLLAMAASVKPAGKAHLEHVTMLVEEILLHNRLARGVGLKGAAAGLTPKQQMLLPLLAQGLNNEAIAAELGISESTVKDHLRKLHGVAGTANRTQLALWASRQMTA